MEKEIKHYLQFIDSYQELFKMQYINQTLESVQLISQMISNINSSTILQSCIPDFIDRDKIQNTYDDMMILINSAEIALLQKHINGTYNICKVIHDLKDEIWLMLITTEKKDESTLNHAPGWDMYNSGKF